jgi:hypothetical protein
MSGCSHGPTAIVTGLHCGERRDWKAGPYYCVAARTHGRNRHRWLPAYDVTIDGAAPPRSKGGKQ